MPTEITITKFMDELGEELLAKKKVENATVSTYLRNLAILNGRKSFSSLAFLRDVEGIMKKMDHYALSSKKNFLATIASVLSLETTPIYKRLYETYSKKLKEAHGVLAETRGDTLDPTPKEKEN